MTQSAASARGLSRRRGQPCRPDRAGRGPLARRTPPTAIDTICDQGEGCPVPDLGPSPDDDPSKDEESHYVKFLKLQAQFAEYAGCTEQLPPEPPPPAADHARGHRRPSCSRRACWCDFPDNPVDGRLSRRAIGAIADFCSALFQYMLIMTETIYRVPPDEAETVLQRRAAPLDDLGARQIYPHDPPDPDPARRLSGQGDGRRPSRMSTSGGRVDSVRRADRSNAATRGDRRRQCRGQAPKPDSATSRDRERTAI